MYRETKGRNGEFSRRYIPDIVRGPFPSVLHHFRYRILCSTFVLSCLTSVTASHGQSQCISPHGTLTRVREVSPWRGDRWSWNAALWVVCRYIGYSKFMISAAWMTDNFHELLQLPIYLATFELHFPCRERLTYFSRLSFGVYAACCVE